jgi:hypothetical protein
MNSVLTAPLPCQDGAFVRLRVQRIEEDIQAAQEKVRRIEHRIQRDREALLLWQARLAGIAHANQLSQ